MAFQVPRYGAGNVPMRGGNQLPSVRQTAAPTADQLGGNARKPHNYVLEGLSRFGDATEKVGLQMRDREDSDILLRAEVAREEALRAKREEWSNRRGVQAWGLSNDVSRWWDEEAPKFTEGMDERQLRAYQQREVKARAESLDNASRYETQQRHASQTEAVNASIVLQTNRAVDNPETADDAAREINALVTMQQGIQGWTQEETEHKRSVALSTMHAQVVQSLIRTNPDLAEQYFAARGHNITDAAVRQKVETALEAGTVLRKAQTFADKLEAEGVEEADGLRRIRAELDGEEEKAAVAEWRSRAVSYREANNRTQEAAREQATEQYLSGGLSSIDPNLIAAMGARNWQAMQREHENLLAQRESRANAAEQRLLAAETRDWTRSQRVRTAAEQARVDAERAKEREGFALFDALFETATSTDRDTVAAFASTDLTVHLGDLSQSQYTTLRKMQAAVRKGEGDPEVVNDRAIARAIKPVTDQWRWTGAKHADKRGALTEAVREEVYARQAREGRVLPQKEIEEIARELAMAGSVSSSIPFMDDRNVPLFSVLGTDRESRWTPGGTRGPQPRNPDGTPVEPAAPTTSGHRVVIRNGERYEFDPRDQQWYHRK